MFFRVYYNQRSEIQEEHRRDLEVIRMLTKQQKHEQDMQRIRKFRLFDDDFLKKCFEDHDECAELVLRIIMNKRGSLRFFILKRNMSSRICRGVPLGWM